MNNTLYLYISRNLNAILLVSMEFFYTVVLVLYLSKGPEYFFHHCLIVYTSALKHILYTVHNVNRKRIKIFLNAGDLREQMK